MYYYFVLYNIIGGIINHRSTLSKIIKSAPLSNVIANKTTFIYAKHLNN